MAIMMKAMFSGHRCGPEGGFRGLATRLFYRILSLETCAGFVRREPRDSACGSLCTIQTHQRFRASSQAFPGLRSFKEYDDRDAHFPGGKNTRLGRPSLAGFGGSAR